MKILRHEEFKVECEASCNGGFKSPWSKTMIGYGPESENFALEIVFNHNVKKYQEGNDVLFI